MYLLLCVFDRYLIDGCSHNGLIKLDLELLPGVNIWNIKVYICVACTFDLIYGPHPKQTFCSILIFHVH